MVSSLSHKQASHMPAVLVNCFSRILCLDQRTPEKTHLSKFHAVVPLFHLFFPSLSPFVLLLFPCCFLHTCALHVFFTHPFGFSKTPFSLRFPDMQVPPGKYEKVIPSDIFFRLMMFEISRPINIAKICTGLWIWREFRLSIFGLTGTHLYISIDPHYPLSTPAPFSIPVPSPQRQ